MVTPYDFIHRLNLSADITDFGSERVKTYFHVRMIRSRDRLLNGLNCTHKRLLKGYSSNKRVLLVYSIEKQK